MSRSGPISVVLWGGKQVHAGPLMGDSRRSIRGNRDSVECKGCVHNARCSYGRVFEPDWAVIERSRIRAGMREGLRAMTISAELAQTPFREMVRQCHASLEGQTGTNAEFPRVWVETERSNRPGHRKLPRAGVGGHRARNRPDTAGFRGPHASQDPNGCSRRLGRADSCPGQRPGPLP